jgi:hypothetical protein
VARPYDAFHGHLESAHRRVLADEHCVVYELLDAPGAGAPAGRKKSRDRVPTAGVGRDAAKKPARKAAPQATTNGTRAGAAVPAGKPGKRVPPAAARRGGPAAAKRPGRRGGK